jgi:6-phosphofructokinase 2
VRVVTVTVNPTVDVNTAVDAVAPEHKLRCDPPHYEPGGGGVNVSRAMTRLGAASLALYLSGGSHGALLDELLDAEGLERRAIPIAGATREGFIVFERATGQQYRFGLPGPEVDEGVWRTLIETLVDSRPKPDYVVASGSLPPGMREDFYAQLAAALRPHGTRVVLDTSGAALQEGIAGGVYLIKPNLAEFARLVRRELPHEEDKVEAARELVASGRVEVVLISLGAGGALLVTADEDAFLRAPTVPIQSKVGAGDSMVAGVVTALVRGWSVREAARFGVAAGAAAVMTPGTELCRRDDTERLYRAARARAESGAGAGRV